MRVQSANFWATVTCLLVEENTCEQFLMTVVGDKSVEGDVVCVRWKARRMQGQSKCGRWSFLLTISSSQLLSTLVPVHDFLEDLRDSVSSSSFDSVEEEQRNKFWAAV
jgi:hypothetical protein